LEDIKKEFFPLVSSPELFAKKDEVFSYADFIFYELLSAFRHIFPASITPTLAAYIQRFEGLPGIKEYIANPSINLKNFFFKIA